MLPLVGNGGRMSKILFFRKNAALVGKKPTYWLMLVGEYCFKFNQFDYCAILKILPIFIYGIARWLFNS